MTYKEVYDFLTKILAMACKDIPERVTTMMADPPFIRLMDVAMRKPRYDQDTCKDGMVFLERTDNKMIEDILCPKLHECYPGPREAEALYYNTIHGSERLRSVMANFLTRYMKAKAPLDPEKLLVTVGATGALHFIAMATANQGDYYLIPSPCYFRIGPDMKEGAGVLPFYVPMSQKDTSLREGLSAAFVTATKEGKRVRGVVLSNPDNPTGRVYSREEIMAALEFCARNQMHAVLDEVYALSVYGDAVFDSVLSFPELPDPNRTHFIWSLSKDFSLSGYRMGVLYTHNELMLQYLRKLIIMYQIPMISQITISNFLSDHEWMDTVFFPTKMRRLREKYNEVRTRLQNIGIEVYPSQAGLYVWCNFSKYMTEKTFEAERELDRQLVETGVLLVSGECFFNPEPGWFRIVFTLEEDITNEGLSRLESFLLKRQRKE